MTGESTVYSLQLQKSPKMFFVLKENFNSFPISCIFIVLYVQTQQRNTVIVITALSLLFHSDINFKSDTFSLKVYAPVNCTHYVMCWHFNRQEEYRFVSLSAKSRKTFCALQRKGERHCKMLDWTEEGPLHNQNVVHRSRSRHLGCPKCSPIVKNVRVFAAFLFCHQCCQLQAR